MKLKIPRRWLTEEVRAVLRDMDLKYLGEEGEYVVFESPFGIGVSRKDLGLGARELRQFTKEVVVEGGTKSCSRHMFHARPLASRIVSVRFPPEMYKLIEEYGKETGRTPSQVIVDAVGNALLQWLEKKREIEEEKRKEEIG